MDGTARAVTAPAVLALSRALCDLHPFSTLTPPVPDPSTTHPAHCPTNGICRGKALHPVRAGKKYFPLGY